MTASETNARPVVENVPLSMHDAEIGLEAELSRQCAELERQLRQDPLSFENEALEVQLAQMQDDFASLQGDFRGVQEYFEEKIAEMGTQLEEQHRTAGTAEGHADCLRDLLHFHEDQGQLAGSYWRAQCEKRDDSIRFLTLKLQEYTVPSAEYQTQRLKMDAAKLGAAAPQVELQLPLIRSAALSEDGVAVSPQSAGLSFQALLEKHLELCREFQEQETATRGVQLRCDANELDHAASTAALQVWTSGENEVPETGNQNHTEDTDEEQRILLSEIEALKEQTAAAYAEQEQLPPWAHRCTWRDELDVRAGQLERISLQFDATKRSLDAANEELQWQATSAEALRMRLADVLRAVKAEELKTGELHTGHMMSKEAVQQLLECWTHARGGANGGSAAGGLPLVCQQAQLLLSRFGEQEEEMAKDTSAQTGGDNSTSPAPPPPPEPAPSVS